MAFETFLKIDNGATIRGESTDARHPDEIEILAASTGVSNPISGAITGGGGSGRASFTGVNLTGRLDSSTPPLFQACAAGRHFATAVLTMRKAGATPFEFLIWTLRDVSVESLQITGSSGGGDDRPTVEFTLAFASINIRYFPQKPDGTAGDPIVGGWDLARNVPV